MFQIALTLLVVAVALTYLIRRYSRGYRSEVSSCASCSTCAESHREAPGFAGQCECSGRFPNQPCDGDPDRL